LCKSLVTVSIMSLLNARYFRRDTALTSTLKWEETYSSIVSRLSLILSNSRNTVVAAHTTLEKKRTRAEYPELFHTIINHKLSESSHSIDETKLMFLTHQVLQVHSNSLQNITEFCSDNADKFPEYMSIPRPPPHIADVPARLRLIQRYF
jgi:hypothetical protein